MIVKVKDLKDVCSIILSAVDSSDLSKISDILELKAIDNTLYLSVTNREYFVKVELPSSYGDDFHATVNASLFLNLVQQTTVEDLDINTEGQILTIKGNGSYKIPLIFNDDKMLELPELVINNVTNTFDIDTSILQSILKFNSKELSRGIVVRPVQQLYYIDNEGCITFTSGACVNNFTLPEKVSLLFTNKLVKLFKLFKEDKVKFTLGYDSISDEIIQAKVNFKCANISISSIIQNDVSLFNSIPVKAIRDRANKIYNYSITLNRQVFLQSLNRLSLFTKQLDKTQQYLKFNFKDSDVDISDINGRNVESISYESTISIDSNYEAILDVVDLKSIIETSNDSYINMKFGDHSAVIISRSNVVNVVPECMMD